MPGATGSDPTPGPGPGPGAEPESDSESLSARAAGRRDSESRVRVCHWQPNAAVVTVAASLSLPTRSRWSESRALFRVLRLSLADSDVQVAGRSPAGIMMQVVRAARVRVSLRGSLRLQRSLELVDQVVRGW